MADQAVLKYLSIDTTFDPCYLSLDSTFKGEKMTKVVKNTLPGHEKLKIYTTKSNLGGVNLVGLSL